MTRGSEVVARGEVRVGPRVHDVVGQAPGLRDPVVGATVAERRVPAPRPQPELPEHGADPAPRLLAPAIFVLVPGSDVVVPRVAPVPRLELDLVAAEAPARHLELARPGRRAAPRDQVDRGTERIAAEQH